MWFDGWDDLGRVAAMGLLSYAVLLVYLRLSGSRTLSTLNAFDLVVTVALGSTLATTILSRDVSFSEGALALGLLVLLQYAISWLNFRMGIDRAIKSEPTLLVRDGEIIADALRRARVTREEIDQVVRREGAESPHDVAAVILESNGQFSVIRKAEGRAHALNQVTD